MDLTELTRRPTSEEINAMPLRHYEGPVEVVRTPVAWARAEADMRADGILGFDTETRPTFRKGKLNAPSLIQIATAERVYLVQLGWLPFGEACAKLLASPDIIKTGVSIGDDMRALARIHPFTPAGLVDLGQVARAHKLPNQGLRTLAASLFGWRISKGSQCSNWSLMDLSQRQIEYAATDAWIGRLIYLRLRELGLTEGISTEPAAPRKRRGRCA
ncbi:3'-5' exonuclease [Desulfovibrio sp.]|uniref:3'-5' exonuclease n=1 Tax=Desulfovibrio sp. TaxID=885 RepID=UPI0023BBCA22|nr:3'-5' exonuclease [Desulfovibrio sp.]MDE7241731.1 3'-5' exonuclease domain-containing protein 2 [Desulfovibrio sp.]